MPTFHYNQRISHHIWYIGKYHNNNIYYLTDIDDNSAVIWSSRRYNGITFKTIAGIHNFIDTELHNRTDVVVVQIDQVLNNGQ